MSGARRHEFPSKTVVNIYETRDRPQRAFFTEFVNGTKACYIFSRNGNGISDRIWRKPRTCAWCWKKRLGFETRARPCLTTKLPNETKVTVDCNIYVSLKKKQNLGELQASKCTFSPCNWKWNKSTFSPCS